MYSSNFQTSKRVDSKTYTHTNSCVLYWNNCMKSIKKWFDEKFDCLKPPHKRLNPILSRDLNNYLFADGNQSSVTTFITKKGKKYTIRDEHIILDTNSCSDSEDLGMYQPPRPEITVTESYESVISSDDDSSDLELSNSSIRQLGTGDSLEVSNNAVL